MESLCDKLRRNDPSVQDCSINVSNGVQIVEALRANTCVKKVQINLERDPGLDLNHSTAETISEMTAAFMKALENFFYAAKYVKTVCFGKAYGEYYGMKNELFSMLLNYVTKNPLVAELVCSEFTVPTEKIIQILRMQGLRRLYIGLHAANHDSQVVADAFAANRTLEYLNLRETADLSVVEAVLPQLSLNPSLSELIVFGGFLGHNGGRNRGLPDKYKPMNTVAFVSSLQWMLVASSALTELSLIGFVFSEENISALVSGLKENQSVSLLRLQCCWFENDGCGESFATFMKSINVTNPNLHHLDILGSEIKGGHPTLPPMVVQAPLRVLHIGNHVAKLCREWVRNPDCVQLRSLLLRAFDDINDWEVLVKSLPNMKSIRELTISELDEPCTLIVQHMRNHWNLQAVVLRRGGQDLLTEREHQLVDAFGMRNKHVPRMLSNPAIPDGDEISPDGSRGANKMGENQDAEGQTSISLFPALFQTALRTKSKSPHILLLGLLSAGYAIGPAKHGGKPGLPRDFNYSSIPFRCERNILI